MLETTPCEADASFLDGMASPKQEAPSDSGLIERMAAGDERALGSLYDRHGAVAYSLAYGILKNAADAEEVMADAFVQAWRTAAGFESSRGSVLAWLITITRSRALDRVRSRQRHAKARGLSTLERIVSGPVRVSGRDQL